MKKILLMALALLAPVLAKADLAQTQTAIVQQTQTAIAGSRTPTWTPTTSPTPTGTPSNSPNYTPTPTYSITNTLTVSPTFSISATFTFSPTTTPSPSKTLTVTQTATRTTSPTLTQSESKTATMTGTPSPTTSPTRTTSPTLTPSQSPTPTAQITNVTTTQSSGSVLVTWNSNNINIYGLISVYVTYGPNSGAYPFTAIGFYNSTTAAYNVTVPQTGLFYYTVNVTTSQGLFSAGPYTQSAPATPTPSAPTGPMVYFFETLTFSANTTAPSLYLVNTKYAPKAIISAVVLDGPGGVTSTSTVIDFFANTFDAHAYTPASTLGISPGWGQRIGIYDNSAFTDTSEVVKVRLGYSY